MIQNDREIEGILTIKFMFGGWNGGGIWDFIWQEDTAHVETKVLSDCGKTCDVENRLR